MNRERGEEEMTSKVYVVVEDASEQYDPALPELRGVFTTREKAEAWVASVALPDRGWLQIYEVDVDPEQQQARAR
jgi:hypothetical protein